MRALLVGCGGMGNNWARQLLPRQDIDIVGVVDIAPAASDALKSRHGLNVPAFAALDDALNALAVDVVLDTSVPETRRRIAGTALEAAAMCCRKSRWRCRSPTRENCSVSPSAPARRTP